MTHIRYNLRNACKPNVQKKLKHVHYDIICRITLTGIKQYY